MLIKPTRTLPKNIICALIQQEEITLDHFLNHLSVGTTIFLSYCQRFYPSTIFHMLNNSSIFAFECNGFLYGPLGYLYNMAKVQSFLYFCVT